MNTADKNFMLGVVHECIWGASVGLTNPYTILPLALVDLGGQGALAGLLAALLFTSANLPQVFSAFLFGPRFTDSFWAALLHLPAIFGTFLAAMTFVFLPEHLAAWKLPLFLASFAIHHLGIGIVTPYWAACIGRNIVESKRGRYFGTSFFFSGLAAALTGWVAGYWAAKGGLRWGYGLCFGLAVPCQLISACVLALTTPILEPPDPPRSSLTRYFELQWKKLWHGGPFLIATVLAVLMQVAGASANLYTVYLKKRAVADSWFALYTPVFSLGSMLGALVLGTLHDRKGTRHSLWLAFAAMLASLCLVASLRLPSLQSFSFFTSGFFQSAYPVVTTVMVLSLAGTRQSTVQIGLFNTLMAPWNFLAPLLLGALAEAAGYRYAFAISAGACLLGFVLLAYKTSFGRHEPVSIKSPQF